jgi:hypothetical protein
MKRKFRALLTFLRPYQEEISFYWNSYDDSFEITMDMLED